MGRGQSEVLYPEEYVWLVLVSSLDIMLTWVVLHLGGMEVNAVAAGVIERHGLAGLVAFKFVFVAIVIVVCEIVGRRRPRAGRGLARGAIGVTCVPVVVALMLVAGRG